MLKLNHTLKTLRLGTNALVRPSACSLVLRALFFVPALLRRQQSSDKSCQGPQR